jgi:hypothetical protein
MRPIKTIIFCVIPYGIAICFITLRKMYFHENTWVCERGRKEEDIKSHEVRALQ